MANTRKTSQPKTVSPREETAPASPEIAAAKAVKIALLGFGTVGSSVARVLAEAKLPGIELTHIFNRGVAR